MNILICQTYFSIFKIEKTIFSTFYIMIIVAKKSNDIKGVFDERCYYKKMYEFNKKISRL